MTAETTETWTHNHNGGARSFEVFTRTGKPLDIGSFRGFSVEQHQQYIDDIQIAADRLFSSPDSLEQIQQCPACDADLSAAAGVAEFYGVKYVRCAVCEHLCVSHQPDLESLNRYFEDSEDVSSIYTDAAATAIRMQQVIAPKLNWVRETYQRLHSRDVASVLDIGAGAGHFVAGCRQEGLKSDGFEINRAAVAYAAEAFDIQLQQGDFLAPGAAASSQYDVLTLWGVLEYTPDPAAFLNAARRWLQPEEGLLIVEVPRSDAMSTVSQIAWTSTPARHAVPTSHVNLFSDGSLATLLYRCGFAPVAAWYFGMDAFEMLSQQAMQLGSAEVMEQLGGAIPALQSAFDRGRICDDIIIAAAPLSTVGDQANADAHPA